MQFLRNGLSALGRLLVVVSLAAAFFVGVFGVFYLQLSGEEIEIPKVVGKNFNVGQEELAKVGLRVKKIATRFSNEDPNTILEQRPRAGTIAKSGLIISVVVSEKDPDGTEPPVEIKDDDEAIEEIEDLPELKTDKSKNRPSKKEDKEEPKTRDVIDPADGAPSGTDADAKGTGDVPGQDAGDGSANPVRTPPPLGTDKKNTETPKPQNPVKPPPKPPGNGENRPRTSGEGN